MNRYVFLFFIIYTNAFSQKMSTQYRFLNTPYYFSISCAGGTMPSDNCGITYHNRIPEAYISTDIPYLVNNFHEVDENGKKLGKFTFQDDFTGYYLRYKDNKKMLFRSVQLDDFEDLITDEKIENDLIGKKVKSWTFYDISEFVKVTRISNFHSTRQLGFHLRDFKSSKRYYMVLEVQYKFDRSFEIDKIKQISFSAL